MESEQNLKNIFSGLFGSEIEDSSSPESIQSWDSMGHVLLVGEIERGFNVRLTLNEIASMTSVNEIKKVLMRHNAWKD